MFRRMTTCAYCRKTPIGTKLWVSGWRGFRAKSYKLFCDRECWDKYRQMPTHNTMQSDGLIFTEEHNADNA
jgi:hypothetical protein